MKEKCDAYFDLNGPVSFFKAIVSGQLCEADVMGYCALCGKGRCSSHLIESRDSGELHCLIDNPEQCYSKRSSVRVGTGPAPSRESVPSPIQRASSCSNLNHIKASWESSAATTSGSSPLRRLSAALLGTSSGGR